MLAGEVPFLTEHPGDRDRALPLQRPHHRGDRVLRRYRDTYMHVIRHQVPFHDVAEVLSATLDMLVTQQIRVPWHDAWQGERPMGAVASGGVRILDAKVVDALKLPPQEVEQAAALARTELANKERAWRGGCPFPESRGRIVILVDDGLETASPMQAAVEAMRARGGMHVIVAAPVGCISACEQLAQQADEVICLRKVNFSTAPLFYRGCPRNTDEGVHALLDRRARVSEVGRREGIATQEASLK